jgi:hypothetical protein
MQPLKPFVGCNCYYLVVRRQAAASCTYSAQRLQARHLTSSVLVQGAAFNDDTAM